MKPASAMSFALKKPGRSVLVCACTGTDFAVPACSQFREGGKPDIAVRFHFHSKTLPMGNVTKKPLLRSPEQHLQPRYLMEVVVKGEHHQHQHQNQPHAEPVFLRFL